MTIFFSTKAFNGFNGVVKSTGPWITVSKTVDLTKAFYGTKPKVVNTAFNFLKWMLRINSIKNLIKKLSKTLFKFGIGFTKKVAKASAKIATFIGRKTVRGITSVGKFIGKNTLKLAKGAFKQIKNILKHIITPFKRLGKVIKNKVIKWFRRIKNTVKMVIRVISKPIKKMIDPLLRPFKRFVRKIYGSVKNFVVTKTGAMWNKDKTAFTKTKNGIKGFKKNAVMLMSKNKNEVVGKATGFGRNVEAFKLKTKRKAIQKGKAAAKWVKNTKIYKGAAKTVKFAAKLVGWVAAGIKWFFRIFKQIFKVIFTRILKPIASLMGITLAAPTGGLSFLIPIICGIIFEFWMIKDEFFEAGWFKRLKLFGDFLFNVLTWCVPGAVSWAIMAIQLAPLIAEVGPMVWGMIRGQWDEYQEWKAQGLDEYGPPGNDVVFNVETSIKLENIKDLEKSTFTRRFLYARNKTNQYNKNIIDIIDCIQTNQQKRTILLQNCNSVFAAYPTF